jgi:hypothetical protein
MFLPLLAFSQALDEHTVLLLNFEGDSLVSEGGELARITDHSGNNNEALVNTQGGDPAITGNPSGPPAVVPGKFGNALYFDGTNYLEVMTSESVEIVDQITLEAWIKPDVLSLGADNMTILTKDCSYYMVLRNNGFLATYFYGVNPPGYHLSPGALETGEWSHVAITYDGSQVTLYINSEVAAEVDAGGEILLSDCANCDDPQSIGIGCEVRLPERNLPNQRFFQGAIDEVRISNVARTADKIKKSFTDGLEIPVEPEGKLAATWGLIKSSGSSR